jgi:hypothetical protein
MDFYFWIPWTIGLVVFILWIKNPISEFKKIWDEQHAKQKDSADDN